MRYSLLSYICCPYCRGALACFVARETATPISPFVAAEAARSPVAGAAFAVAAGTPTTPLGRQLAARGAAAAPTRNREAEVESGVLVCGTCARWFPILDTLPELLPDHLRDADRDHALLDTLAAGLPPEIRSALRRVATDAGVDDKGIGHKRAEMTIADKIENPDSFFGPGYSAPFNPGSTGFTIYLIKLFASVVALLDTRRNAHAMVVVDSGCGYAWTTEWLAKSGIEAIGVDISRLYLEIGMRRMGPSRPNLVVGDVEHLPIADGCADAVLAYESFHHVPNRRAAMAGYARALKEGGSIVLAEPGRAHEEAEVSVDAMDKYGILEKGMEIDDVEGYIEGLPFAPPEQHYILHASASDLERGIPLLAAWQHSLFHGNTFRIRKDSTAVAAAGAPDHRARETAPVPTAGTELEEMKRTHARLAREWDAELQRTAHALRKVTSDLARAEATIRAVESSAFWRVRRMWVGLASLFGSQRGDLPAEKPRR